jgi:hypothetical protein
MISLIVSICILGLIYWVCTLIVPQPFLKIIMVVLVVIAILMILKAFGIYSGIILK